MPDYKKVYTELFNATTDAIHILQKSQLASEGIYIAEDNPPIALLPKNDEGKRKNSD